MGVVLALQARLALRDFYHGAVYLTKVAPFPDNEYLRGEVWAVRSTFGITFHVAGSTRPSAYIGDLRAIRAMPEKWCSGIDPIPEEPKVDH